MSIHSLLNSRTSTPTRRRPIRRRPPSSRLFLESLEDRCLLSFSPAVSYPVGNAPQAVVTGDFNGDGKIDLVTANDGGLTVLLGAGTGAFRGPLNVDIATFPVAVAIGDFNGDGRRDVVSANNWNTNDVSVLLNDGT